jgi:hypothetical protein
MFKHKTLYVVFGTLGALALFLGIAGVAYAQGPQPAVGDQPFFGDGPCYGPGVAGPMIGGSTWRAGNFSLVDATAEATGLTVDKVIAALGEGQTLANIAEAQGVDPQAIVDTFLAEREAALQEAVDAGRLTQEQVDQMLEQMAEHLTEQLDEAWEARYLGGSGMGQMGRGRWSRPGMGIAPRFTPSQ